MINNSSNNLIRPLEWRYQRKSSELKNIAIGANPIGRYHKKSASNDRTIIEKNGAARGFFSKKAKIKQNNTSGEGY